MDYTVFDCFHLPSSDTQPTIFKVEKIGAYSPEEAAMIFYNKLVNEVAPITFKNKTRILLYSNPDMNSYQMIVEARIENNT